jgi:hypothetical protein
VPSDGLACHLGAGQGASLRCLREEHEQRERVAATVCCGSATSAEAIGVGTRASDLDVVICAGLHPVARGVEPALQRDATRVARDFPGAVCFGLAPVGWIGIEVARDAGEAEIDGESAVGEQRRAEPHQDQIERGVHARLDLHLLAVEHELAAQPARPQIEGLLRR